MNFINKAELNGQSTVYTKHIPFAYKIFVICFWVITNSCIAAPAKTKSLFEQRYIRCSNILTGRVLETGFEDKDDSSEICRYFAKVNIDEIFKGNLVSRDTIKIFIGGITFYNNRTWQVCENNLPVNSKRLFFLGYLFPDERAFTSGAQFFLDVLKTIDKDTVLIHNPGPRYISLNELKNKISKLNNKYNPKNILNNSKLIVTGKIKKINSRRTGKGLYNTDINIHVQNRIKGSIPDDSITISFTDNYRRIHYRNRKRNDIPFYISKNKKVLNEELKRNFFLTVGETKLFCLTEENGKYRVYSGISGIFCLDESNRISNRWFLNVPTDINSILNLSPVTNPH